MHDDLVVHEPRRVGLGLLAVVVLTLGVNARLAVLVDHHTNRFVSGFGDAGDVERGDVVDLFLAVVAHVEGIGDVVFAVVLAVLDGVEIFWQPVVGDVGDVKRLLGAERNRLAGEVLPLAEGEALGDRRAVDLDDQIAPFGDKHGNDEQDQQHSRHAADDDAENLAALFQSDDLSGIGGDVELPYRWIGSLLVV